MRASMDKYKLLIGVYIKEYKQYPIGLFLKLIYLPVQMLMSIFLWVNISKSNEVDLKYLISYYLLTNLILYAYPFIHISRSIENDVMEGNIANCLVRPYKYITPIISKYLGWMCIYSIIFIPALIFIYFYRGISLFQIIIFIIFSFIGMFIEFIFWYNLGLIALFIERIRGVLAVAGAIRIFVSGGLIPLSFFPEVLKNIMYLFPFRFYVYVPVDLLLGKHDIGYIYFNLGLGILWIIILWILSKILWNKGVGSLQSNMS